jgi:transcriptional regulator with XRE-family HTH domain
MKARKKRTTQRGKAETESEVQGTGEAERSSRTSREDLAKRLRDAREYLGLTQEQAAAAAHLSRLALSTIETNRRRVESVELSALARVYGQPVSYFLSETSPAEDGRVPEDVQHIARTAHKLTPGDREELLRFAEYLHTFRPVRRRD